MPVGELAGRDGHVGGRDPINRADPAGTDYYDSQTPCAKYDCGPGNYDRSENASPNATNKPENGWRPPPRKPAEPESPAPKPKKKSRCGWLSAVCHAAKKGFDESVKWAQNHSDVVGLAAGIGVGVGCAALTGGGGAIVCGALGGMVQAAVVGGLEMSKPGSNYGWGDLAKDVVVGGLMGAATGAIMPVGGALGKGLGGGVLEQGSKVFTKSVVSGTRTALGEVGKDSLKALKNLGPKNVGNFVKGSGHAIKAEFNALRAKAGGSAVKGLGKQALAIGKDYGKGLFTDGAIVPALLSGIIPQASGDFGDGKSFRWQNALPQWLGGPFT
ncbi:hypothetical protein AB0J72_09575 [Dactylosporangium sp. NPDC049742]|uniref:hypothetical protein n=1 Tax=Dactylosporangium sp. NPDC049742 TaxID=3154737 RepID=UPI003447ABB9